MLGRSDPTQPLRRTPRPAKQLSFLWLCRDMKASAAFQDGLDVACAEMKFRPLFRTATYTGIDIDEARMDVGLRTHPDAAAEVCSVENLSCQGDFVLCVQTIGFNKHFDPANTLLAIDKLIAATRPAGTLIVNTGKRSTDYIPQVSSRLRAGFARVTERHYGALRGTECSFGNSLRLAHIMDLLPFLRGRGRAYFVCQGRK